MTISPKNRPFIEEVYADKLELLESGETPFTDFMKIMSCADAVIGLNSREFSDLNDPFLRSSSDSHPFLLARAFLTELDNNPARLLSELGKNGVKWGVFTEQRMGNCLLRSLFGPNRWGISEDISKLKEKVRKCRPDDDPSNEHVYSALKIIVDNFDGSHFLLDRMLPLTTPIKKIRNNALATRSSAAERVCKGLDSSRNKNPPSDGDPFPPKKHQKSWTKQLICMAPKVEIEKREEER